LAATVEVLILTAPAVGLVVDALPAAGVPVDAATLPSSASEKAAFALGLAQSP
jgi:hypothetical protein